MRRPQHMNETRPRRRLRFSLLALVVLTAAGGAAIGLTGRMFMARRAQRLLELHGGAIVKAEEVFHRVGNVTFHSDECVAFGLQRALAVASPSILSAAPALRGLVGVWLYPSDQMAKPC